MTQPRDEKTDDKSKPDQKNEPWKDWGSDENVRKETGREHVEEKRHHR